MRNWIRVSVVGGAFLLVTVAAVSCQTQEEVDLEEVTIGTFSRAIDYSPYYIAQHFRWFEDALEGAGVDVRYQEFSDRESISSAMEDGELHLLFAAAPPVIISRAQGNRIIVCEISCTLQQEIVARRSLPIASAADLRGLEIAVLQGTGSHFGLLNTLRSFGVNEDEVRLRFMLPPEARAAFEAGVIDAWAIWPPFVEEQVLSGNGRVVAGGDAIIQSVVGLDEGLGERNPSVSGSLTEVIRRAKSWILSNPDEAQVIVARAVNLDPEVVELAWGKHDWAARLGPAVYGDLNDKVEFLRAQGLLRRTAPENLAQEIYSADFGGESPLP